MSSWNTRPLPSLSIPRYPPSILPTSFKQVQPTTPSLSSFHRSSSPQHQQPYISSPTCTSPSHSRAPYSAYEDIPPIASPSASAASAASPQSHHASHPLPPNTILVQQPNGQSVLVTLPPPPQQQQSRQASQQPSYFRTAQLLASQSVLPLAAGSSFMRSSSAPSQVLSSSRSVSYYAAATAAAEPSVQSQASATTSTHYYCEPSVSSASTSRMSISRRAGLHSPLHPIADFPSSPSPTPPTAAGVAPLLAAGAVTAGGATSPTAAISFPTGFSPSSWSMFFLSLPASPVFLHYLSVSLVSVHSSLLFLSLLFFLLTLLPSLTPLAQPLCFYLLFYALKSLASLGMSAYRLSHPECWQMDELTGGLSRTAAVRYQVLRHVLRCLSVASTGVVTWWMFSSGDDSWADGTAVSRFVLALLCVEYTSILLPLLSNLILSFFVPCIHLSFYLPYLPFPALHSPSAGEEEDKGGMSEEDLTHLPSSTYHPSAIPRDTTCAVCLCEVEDGEEIRQLTCRHMYHKSCIDSWLRKRGVCPLCVRKVSVRPGRKADGAAGGDVAAVRGGSGVEMAVTSADVTMNVEEAEESGVQQAADMPRPTSVSPTPSSLRYDVDLHPDQLDA